jgi:HEAT repeat protein
VERVGIWRLLDGGRVLVCEDQFTRSTAAHTTGEVVTAHDLPAYFRALQENRVIAAHDACTDSRMPT